ncbi:MAG TPA: Stp1/IreP family PP2C-type Ser/Thr phosphatase [Solirubrobacteraceae bacterium]|nr:Stp1/IreP family PP2C-type Ser/Thr phosphatase [Solirubrobacteraceae bacterium]
MLRVSESIWRTDTGRQRRENEDSAYVRAPMFVVADGMGGAQAGEVASRIAIETFEQAPEAPGPPEARLAELVRDANHRIYDRSRAEQSRAGMGTTLTAAYLDDADLAIAHVGDSRAYLFRGGELRRLTQDHSLVDELVRQGKLTEEQAAEHPQRSIITRALGPEPEVEVDTWSYPVKAGDVMLLCSDGLTSMVSEERVADILGSAPSLRAAADELIREANEAGGRDNITVVLSRFEEVGAEKGVEQPTRVSQLPARPESGQEDEGVGEEAARAAIAVASAPAASGPLSARLAPRRERVAASRPSRRFGKPVAAALAVVIVLFLVGGGGYLASRQLYFIGTNAQGIVTIYRGFPYDLPAGIHLYETYFVSGVPASLVPSDRRSDFFNNQLRSQSDALNLVRELELGDISR